MVTRQQKEEIVSKLKDRLSGSSIAFVADFAQMTMGDLTGLRKSLKNKAECIVVKNTLAKIALQSEENLKPLEPFLKGPSLLVLSKDDPAQTIKLFRTYQKKLATKLVLKGGVLADSQLALDAKGLEAISELPPREAILGAIAGALVSTPASIAQGINQIIGGLGELSVKVAEKQNK